MAEKGRPDKWTELDMPSKLDSVTGWTKQGSTDKEICLMLGVSQAVYYRWKNDYPEFREAIKKGRYVSNGELLNSAFQQASGFYYTEEQAIKLKVGKDLEEVEIVKVEKFCPPNPTMNIFMLKNRLPNDYRDRYETELSGPGGGPIEYTIKMPDGFPATPPVSPAIPANIHTKESNPAQDDEAIPIPIPIPIPEPAHDG